jgi:hypothetical protein
VARQASPVVVVSEARRPRVGVQPRRRPSGALALAVALVLLGAAPSRALEVEVEVGLDGLLVDGAWAPLEVRCTVGPDEPALDGFVVVARPREVVSRIEAPVRAEPGSTVTVRLSVPASSGMTYAVRVVDADGRALAEASPDVPGALLMADERLVVLVGPLGLSSLSDGGAERPRVARVSPERLPRDPHALAAAEAIFLKPTGSTAAHVELARDPAAVAALEAYARAGGTLVLLGGDAAFWSDGPLDALSPARVTGRGEEPPASFEALFGRVEARSIPVIACAPRPDARVLWSGSTYPLVLERTLGRGRVVLVAFDPDRDGLRGAERAGAFLAGLVPGGAAPTVALRASDAEGLVADVIDATPPLGEGWFYLLVLAALTQVVGVSLLTAALARRRGPWVGLVLPPAVSLGVAAALLLLGALARGAPRVTTLLLELREPGGGAVHAAVGIAAGARAAFTVELPPALRPDGQPLTGFDLLRLRGSGAALRERPGRPPVVGPLEVSAHGRGALVLTGRALGEGDAALRAGPRVAARALPIIVTVAPGERPRDDLWPRVEVTSHDERPTDDLRVLVLGPTGARLSAPAALQPGATFTFSPEATDALGAGGDGEERQALGDLTLPAQRAALLERVARRLEAMWVRAIGVAPSGVVSPFPMVWLLHAQVEEGSAVPVLDAAGAPVPRARTVRVTCVSAEAPW